jgi:hypothetical protein
VDDLADDRRLFGGLSDVELASLKRMPEVERITGLSEDTIGREYGHLIVRPSSRTKGISLRNTLEIAAGVAKRARDL